MRWRRRRCRGCAGRRRSRRSDPTDGSGRCRGSERRQRPRRGRYTDSNLLFHESPAWYPVSGRDTRCTVASEFTTAQHGSTPPATSPARRGVLVARRFRGRTDTLHPGGRRSRPQEAYNSSSCSGGECARGSGRCAGIRMCSRMRQTVACSVMKAMIFISAPQYGHSSGSIS